MAVGCANSKWHLGATKDFLPPAKGFDSYLGIPYSVDMGFAYNNRTEESWSEGNYVSVTLHFRASVSLTQGRSAVWLHAAASDQRNNGSRAARQPGFGA